MWGRHPITSEEGRGSGGDKESRVIIGRGAGGLCVFGVDLALILKGASINFCFKFCDKDLVRVGLMSFEEALFAFLELIFAVL